MYSAELSTNIATFVAPAIVIFFLACMLHGYLTKAEPKDLKLKDKFDIGYFYYDMPEKVVLDVVEKPAPKPAPKPRPKTQAKPSPKPKPKTKSEVKPEKQKPTQSPEFVQECIGTLVGLGEKKSVAKRDVIAFLIKNPQVDNIDDFVKGIFKND